MSSCLHETLFFPSDGSIIRINRQINEQSVKSGYMVLRKFFTSGNIHFVHKRRDFHWIDSLPNGFRQINFVSLWHFFSIIPFIPPSADKRGAFRIKTDLMPTVIRSINTIYPHHSPSAYYLLLLCFYFQGKHNTLSLSIWSFHEKSILC